MCLPSCQAHGSATCKFSLLGVYRPTSPMGGPVSRAGPSRAASMPSPCQNASQCDGSRLTRRSLYESDTVTPSQAGAAGLYRAQRAPQKHRRRLGCVPAESGPNRRLLADPTEPMDERISLLFPERNEAKAPLSSPPRETKESFPRDPRVVRQGPQFETRRNAYHLQLTPGSIESH